MSEPKTAAAPVSGDPKAPKLEVLLADPEIAALLDFEPAPRKMARPDGWTPELQRELIARIANCGSPGVAAQQMGKNPSGAKHLYRAEDADSFQSAWQAAMALAEARERDRRAARKLPPVEVPGMARRSRKTQAEPLRPGEVYNEMGYPEDAESLKRRGEEASDSIANKLLSCRRAYLLEISRNPGKRAAFELLTELPIDWDKARRHQPQDHEPWRRPNLREGDMVLTAENGWMGSIVPAYGPDKIGQLQKAVNRARMKRGLPPITDWTEDSENAERSDAGEARSVGLDGRSTQAAAAGAARRDAEPDRPGCDRGASDSSDVTDSLRDDAAPEGPPPPRSFGLNSQEFYDAVAKPGRRARVPTRD